MNVIYEINPPKILEDSVYKHQYLNQEMKNF